jgi:hypothetical protein
MAVRHYDFIRMRPRWFTRESENVEDDKPTVYCDIFEEGREEPIAERILFTAAEKLVEKHNDDET